MLVGRQKLNFGKDHDVTYTDVWMYIWNQSIVLSQFYLNKKFKNNCKGLYCDTFNNG